MEKLHAYLEDFLFDPAMGKIVTTLVGLLLIKLLVGLLQRIASTRIQNKNARYGVRKFLAFAGYLLAAIFLFAVFSSQFRALTVAFGVAGAGIAFALQEVIASIAGWIAVSFGQFYRVGDRVQLGGIKGDVIDVGMLRTTVMEIGAWINGDAYSGRIVRIANSFVFKEPVFNYSSDFPFVWDELTVPVRYGSDYALAKQVLIQAAQETVGDYVPFARATWKEMVKKYLIEEASVEPVATMVANDNWVEFTLRYVVDFKKRRMCKDQIFERVLTRFENSQGKVSFASATFELTTTPALNVRVSEVGGNPAGKE